MVAGDRNDAFNAATFDFLERHRQARTSCGRRIEPCAGRRDECTGAVVKLKGLWSLRPWRCRSRPGRAPTRVPEGGGAAGDHGFGRWSRPGQRPRDLLHPRHRRFFSAVTTRRRPAGPEEIHRAAWPDRAAWAGRPAWRAVEADTVDFAGGHFRKWSSWPAAAWAAATCPGHRPEPARQLRHGVRPGERGRALLRGQGPPG